MTAATGYLDRVVVAVVGTPGTGPVTLGAVIPTYQSFAQAGAVNNGIYPYTIIDGINWEYGYGTYLTAGPSFQRTVILGSSNAGTPIAASINAILTATFLAENAAPLLGMTISGTVVNFISGITLAGSGNNATVVSLGTGSAASFSTAEYTFNSNEGYPSFASTSTHFGFVTQNTKNAASSTTTGSRQAFTCQQLGVGGTTADYFTAGYELCSPTASASFNNSGNFTGNNPYVNIPAGMTPTSAVGEEIDVVTKSNVTNIREGLRIVDIGSTGLGGAGIDAAIGISSTGIGFSNGIYFGDAGGGNFPLPAGGSIINTVVSSVGLASGFNLGGLTGAFTFAPIVLPANNKGIWWGAAKAGGSIVSETTAGGPDIVFGNQLVAFRFGGVSSVYVEANSLIFTPVTIANLPASPSNGQIAYVHDTVGNAAPVYHAHVLGGGATAVDGFVSYNSTLAQWLWN